MEVNDAVAPIAEDRVIAHETRKRINDVLKELPDKTRQVFLLSRSEQLSYAEISKALDISVKTVEYHMGKALIELRSALK
jgi:RNA polymerase sigma-70 factor (ECF subfamily)